LVVKIIRFIVFNDTKLLFAEPDGTVMEEIINESGNPSYKYYFPTTDGIIAAMKKVIEVTKTSESGVGDKEL
jgi:hypothetical protein